MKPISTCIVAGLSLALVSSALAQSTAPTPSAPPSATTQAPADYVLGAEDVISVAVIRHEEFSGDFYIPTTGVIQIPGVGEVNVIGMSLANVQQYVTQQLRTRLKKPEATVTLKAARQRRVYVYGDVQLPGILDMRDGWGVAECLSAAGGLKTGIVDRDCRLIIDRPEKGGSTKRIEVPLVDALNGLTDAQKAAGITPETIRPRPGDVFRFDSIETFSIYINGKVKVPGAYKVRQDNAGILEAIAQAQGVSEGAAVNSIRVIHVGGNEEEVDLTVYLSKDSMRDAALAAGSPTQTTQLGNGGKPLPRLGPGDIIIVPEQMDKVAILGYVTKPGLVTLPAGRKYTLAEAVAAASGPTERGRVTRVGLVRRQNGEDIRKVFDLGRYLTKGDVEQNPEVLPGDIIYVPESSHVAFTSVLQGLASATLFFNYIRR